MAAATASLTCHIGGTLDPAGNAVLGGRVSSRIVLPLDDGATATVGRDPSNDLVVPGDEVGDGVSAFALTIERRGGSYVLWCNALNGASLVHPGDAPVRLSPRDRTDPQPPVPVIARHRTIMAFAGGLRTVHLVFDLPSTVVSAPPAFATAAIVRPTVVMVGSEALPLSVNDKKWLTAVAIDWIVPPPLGLQIATLPGRVAEILLECEPSFVEERRSTSQRLDGKSMSEVIAAFVARVTRTQVDAGFADADLLQAQVERALTHGYSITHAVAYWAHDMGVTTQLDFELAVRMSAARDRMASEKVKQRSDEGRKAAARLNLRRLGLDAAPTSDVP